MTTTEEPYEYVPPVITPEEEAEFRARMAACRSDRSRRGAVTRKANQAAEATD